MIEAAPGATFSAFAEDFDTGLVGTLTVAILGPGEEIHTPATTEGIYESPAGSGNYGTDSLVAPEDAGTYRVYWDDQSGTDALEELVVHEDASEAGGPTIAAHYTDTAALRSELGVDAEILPDDQALKLIADAEDMIDDQLGIRSIDHESGRKVREDEVAAWRWEKLARATLKLARFMYEHPGWGTEQRFSSPGGDIGAAGPYGSPWPAVSALLNDSGLRELTTAITGGRRADSVIGNLPEPD